MIRRIVARKGRYEVRLPDEERALVRGLLGADAFVDLQADRLEEVGEVDVVFDVIGGEVLERSAPLVRAAPAEAYAATRDGELWLLNSNITEYKQAGQFNHTPKRPRKLL